MPYNSGVMFSRCPRFWGEVYTRLRLRDRNEQKWMGDQAVICDMLLDDASPYRVQYLKGTIYNYPPALAQDVVESKTLQAEARIIHYKGSRRKALLLKQEALRCA